MNLLCKILLLIFLSSPAFAAVTHPGGNNGDVQINNNGYFGAVAEIDGDCLKGVSGAWTTGTCGSGSSYTAGSGLTLTGSAFSLNVGHANSWSSLQTFGNDISVGGATFNIGTFATNDLLQYNGTNIVNIQPSTLGFLTGNQTITLSGDASGSGTTGITVDVTQLHGNTLTTNDWCKTDGTIITCTVTPITNTNQLTNGAGFITGNQTITLTGDTTGSGTTSISTTTGALNGTSLAGLSTGILKNTTSTGIPSIAVAADFPTLNQNTTGSAANLTTGRTIAITGDLGYTSPSFNGSGNVTAAGTLATVNTNTGSFGSSTSIPNFTTNGKGLITAAGSNVVIAPAGTLSGTTLNSGVTGSSLTSVGTIGTGVWQGTKVADAYGGTGADSSASTGVAQLNSGTWSWSTALANGTTATTQAIGDTSTDVATDAFVIAQINAQVDIRDPVQSATTTALIFSPTYNNGSSGVGATLTAGTVGVLVMDGYTPNLGDRVLVKNQAAPLQNGCYTLTTVGVVITTDYVLTRCTDFNQVANIDYGDTFPVLQGSTNANQQFTMNNSAFTSVGGGTSTSQITFAQTSGGSQLIAGTGISITGNTIANTGVLSLTGDSLLYSNSASTGATTLALNTQSKNTVLAGPTTGSNAAPTLRALVGADLPNPSASALGGIESIAAVSHNFLTSISTSGVPAQAQPACGDLSNSAASCSTDATNASNISTGTLAAARGGSGTITGALKGNGSGTVSQAACADLSNGGTACSSATGTSGATIPFLNGANTWSGAQTFAANMYVSAGWVETAPYTANTSTSYAINIDNGPLQIITVTGAVAMTITAPTHDGSAKLIIKEDGTGHVYSITGCKWAGGAAITYSTAASKIDIVSIAYDGTNSYCMGGAAFN